MSKMIRKAYKYRIYPNKTQTAIFERTLNLCRELYNAALQERRDAWKLNRISVNFYDQQRQLPEIKKINTEYKQIHSRVLIDVLRRLDKAFNGFFNRIKRGEKAGFPRFKGANRYNSFTYSQSGYSLTENKLTLSKIGTVKVKLSRPMQGKVKTCTIKREANKWFVIFSVETTSELLPKTGKLVGIDVGISSFLTLSDGTKTENPRHFEKLQKKLRVAQRGVSRKKKGGKNRKKAVLKLRKIHQKIKNSRADSHHKLSTRLVKAFDLIAIEKLNIIGMSKGFLAKQIHDASWSSFFDMLRYKAENAGRKLIEVNPRNTSQKCSKCSEIVKKDLSVRVHSCENCGLEIDRDENAAINILTAGLAVSDITYQVTESVSEVSVVV